LRAPLRWSWAFLFVKITKAFYLFHQGFIQFLKQPSFEMKSKLNESVSSFDVALQQHETSSLIPTNFVI